MVAHVAPTPAVLEGNVTRVDTKARAKEPDQQSPGLSYERVRTAGVAKAESVVLAASNTEEDRFLAVNAMGALSRSATGRPALERLSESAPSEELRRVARVLLARR